VQATITFTPNWLPGSAAKAGIISNAKDSPATAELQGTGLTNSSYSADLHGKLAPATSLATTFIVHHAWAVRIAKSTPPFSP